MEEISDNDDKLGDRLINIRVDGEHVKHESSGGKFWDTL